jgi:peptide chain release factor 1
VAAGVPLIVAGVLGLLVDSDLTHPPRAAVWLVGAAVAHDAVWLPLVLLVAAGAARLLPTVARGPVVAALGLTAVLVVVAWPFAAGLGEDPHDPSVLVRDEATGTAAYVAAVWVVAGLEVGRRARAKRRPGRWAGRSRPRSQPPVPWSTVLDRLAELDREFREVEARLADPDLLADQTRYQQVAKRYRELGPIVERYRTLEQRQGDLATAREMTRDATADEREMLKGEADEAEADIARLTDEMRLLLLPKDPNDERNVIVEIRGAEGGEEANLWARDLFEMYRAFATRQGWTVEMLGSDPSDLGGFNEVTLALKGDGVWSRMHHEAGPHRVQRVPVTESQGRVHTSSATVTVLPEAEEVDVDLDPNDLKVDVFRSSGPGGQSVNTTDSAVRITHIPTGIVVSMQDEKSQIQNRAKALQVLRSRLLKAEQDKAAAEASEARRSQVGAGGRADKVRTYNYKDNRVTDHRIGLTVHKLDKVLAGELDDISDALVADEQARRLSDQA